MKNIFIGTICLLFISGFSYCQRISSLYKEDSSIEINILVMRENCSKAKMNLCHMASDFRFRPSPFLIELDTNNVLEGYVKGVFHSALYAKSTKKDSYDVFNTIDLEDKMDSIFNRLSSDENLIDIYDRRYKRRINKYLKRLRTSHPFDGHFYFNTFQISARVVYDGKSKVAFPCIFTKCENVGCTIECNCYIILDINSITPYRYRRTYKKISFNKIIPFSSS